MIVGIENCEEVVREIERATDLFFNAECRLQEARMRAMDPRSYDVVNQLIALAQLDFAVASGIFLEVAGQIDASLELAEGEQTSEAHVILKIYGYSPPKTYDETFRILANAIGQAAKELAEVRVGEGGNESFALDSMYGLSGAMVRPGGVFRAIATLLRQAVV